MNFFFHASLVPAVSSLRARGAHASLVGGMHDGPFVFLACDSGHLWCLGVSFLVQDSRDCNAGVAGIRSSDVGVRHRFGGAGAPHSFLFSRSSNYIPTPCL